MLSLPFVFPNPAQQVPAAGVYFGMIGFLRIQCEDHVGQKRRLFLTADAMLHMLRDFFGKRTLQGRIDKPGKQLERFFVCQLICVLCDHVFNCLLSVSAPAIGADKMFLRFFRA